ncbi:MAG: MdtA/MuxA family multidrug efflux RND transporter periplasmic adaptor subunit [Betaproteobacteria bacterium]|nr:MdtA/MuxA family multidrug efflux RND transporter periplasmic adaptor subunit [Betaproteobacteria bacterium]
MKGRSLWITGFIVIALGAGGGYYYYYANEKPAPEQARPEGGRGFGKKGDGANRVTPVVAQPAKKGDVKVYLTSLGTVTPVRTVTVRSRVDGQIMRVLFREGQLVRQGDVLVEIDPRPFQAQLTQVEGQLLRDNALLTNARIDLERYRTLLAQDSIAKQQVDTQDALVRQYEGTVKLDQGQLENARLQLAYARVTAPISGRLGLRQVDEGNVVRSGDANGLVVITQQQPITVLFTLPQDNLPVVMKRVQSGERIPVEALDRDQNQKAPLGAGVLLTVDNQIDTTTGTVRLKAQFANDDSRLFPNQFVNVRMLIDVRRDATTVPSASLQRGARGMFVYVVKEDRTVTLREVKTGPTEGDATVIESGVEPGELIVVDGMDRLREGARVELPGAEKGGERKKGGGNRRKGADAPAEDNAARPRDAAKAEAPAAENAVAPQAGEGERRKGGGQRRKGGEKAAE